MMRALFLCAVSACAIAGSDLSSTDQAVKAGKANIELTSSNAQLLQTSDTPWTLAKTGTVDASTVTWTITATPGVTIGGHLVIDGYLRVANTGSGPATIGNIVVNLQVRQNNQWITVASDIADGTHDDAATHAFVVAAATSDNVSQFSETAASGHLFFMDRMSNTLFSLVPEVSVPAHTSIPLLFAASYNNNLLGLFVGTQARAEIIVTFGNHPKGGGIHTADDVDINGNGVIDPDEAKVKSVSDRIQQQVPAMLAGNATVTLTDALADITTQGTVTFSNPVFNLGATTGTVTVSYSGGASGGTITNCAHADGAGITDQVGGFQYPIVAAFHADACNTQPIHAACVDGAPGCGWQDGDLTTFGQGDWGATPVPGNAAALLQANYDGVYAGTMGVFEIGTDTGFSALFTFSTALLAYLPAAGPAGVFDANTLNPTSTAAGIFGGEVAALKLNIDFSDAGVTAHTASAHFGDLSVCTYAPFSGMTVREVAAAANTAISGAPTGFSITDLDTVANQLNASFGGGAAGTFAQQHLVNGACP